MAKKEYAEVMEVVKADQAMKILGCKKTKFFTHYIKNNLITTYYDHKGTGTLYSVSELKKLVEIEKTKKPNQLLEGQYKILSNCDEK